MLTDKAQGLSDAEILERANKAILKELGMDGYLRYLQLVPNRKGSDYLKIREELNEGTTVEALCREEAEEYKKKK